jgi:hypothetical protein
MFRKLAIAAAAAMTLGAGMAAAPAPASAQGFGLYFGGPGYGHGGPRRHYGYGPGYGYGGPGYYPGRRYYDGPVRRRCEEVVVRKKIRGNWRRVVEVQCYPRRRYY